MIEIIKLPLTNIVVFLSVVTILLVALSAIAVSKEKKKILKRNTKRR